MRISIIIPTLNEEDNIAVLIESLIKNGGESLEEVIVVDGGSIDQTMVLAEKVGAKAVKSPNFGRANQMNYGALMASGDILYFVHADTKVPDSFVSDILQAFEEGYCSGCYRLKFDSKRFMLKINGFFTRYNNLTLRGGDQTLFVERKLFSELKGFDNYYVIMEEYDFLRRLWKEKPGIFKLIAKDALVSARKYDNNSWLRVQIANLTAVIMFRRGIAPKRIVSIYKKMLDYRY